MVFACEMKRAQPFALGNAAVREHDVVVFRFEEIEIFLARARVLERERLEMTVQRARDQHGVGRIVFE
jgi:hypothetical protein